jgi:hypothetical protein
VSALTVGTLLTLARAAEWMANESSPADRGGRCAAYLYQAGEAAREAARAAGASAVTNETRALEGDFPDCAPFGGWLNRALAQVAEREGVNPYELDRLLRGVA